jgi:hypothetical protein
MIETKPKNIKAVGIGIVAVSILVMLSNGSFALIVNHTGGITGFLGPNSTDRFPELYKYWNNIYKLAQLTSTFSLFFIIGGILLIRYNRWSRIFLTSIAVLFIIVMIYMYTNLIIISLGESQLPFTTIVLIYAALILVIAPVFLIIYVNKKQVRKFLNE